MIKQATSKSEYKKKKKQKINLLNKCFSMEDKRQEKLITKKLWETKNLLYFLHKRLILHLN